MREGTSDISAFEGLVGKTTQMFHQQVGLEPDDMRQELRLKVFQALRSYDPERSSMSERAFVYSAVANRVKDLKRDASRRANAPLSLRYIEDFRLGPISLGEEHGDTSWFEYTYCHLARDAVYGSVEDRFVMPATVTDGEREILVFLVLGYDQTEIARELGVERWQIVKAIGQLREKLADWRPNGMPPPLALTGDAPVDRDGTAVALAPAA